MAGRGSLAALMPYGNAYEIVMDMGKEILAAVQHAPALAGVCATDPLLWRVRFLRELRGRRFSGIQNFLPSDLSTASLEQTGMSCQMEIESVAAAHELELLTTPYVFHETDAEHMTKSGAGISVAPNSPLTTSLCERRDPVASVVCEYVILNSGKSG